MSRKRVAATSEPPRFPWTSLAVSVIVVVLVVGVVVLLLRVAGDDFRPAPAEEFPLPAGWRIRFESLSCGSGGCSTRYFMVSTPEIVADPIRAYAAGIRRLGWTVSQREATPNEAYFVGRRDELIVQFSSASSELGKSVLPSSIRKARGVLVLYWDCRYGSLACE